MSDYSKTNLLEIESSSSGMEGVEAYFARKHLDSEELGISLFRYAPNYVGKMAHSHKVQEEAYVVMKGSGTILLDGTTVTLKPLDVIRVAPKVVRAFKSGPDGLEILAVGGKKPEGGDGVRHEPEWPKNS